MTDKEKINKSINETVQPDEIPGISLTSHMLIVDIDTDEILVNKRADV